MQKEICEGLLFVMRDALCNFTLCNMAVLVVMSFKVGKNNNKL